MSFLIRMLVRRLRRNRAEAARNSSAASRSRPNNSYSLVLHQTRYDLLSFFRNRQARFFTVLLPILFLVIFVEVFGSGTVGPQHLKASTFFVPGIAALAVISASFTNLVISVTAQRETGVLKRRRATPVPAAVLIAGRALTSMVVSLGVLAIVLALGNFAFAVAVPLGSLAAIALMAILGSVTFCVLGFAIATLINSADGAQPIVQAMLLPLYFISGVFVPGVNLPGWLQHVAQVFPVQHLADGLHYAYNPALHGSAIAWGDLGVLALWALGGLAVAVRRFKWSPALAVA
jgi:ABC-2 type transport system permease protein